MILAGVDEAGYGPLLGPLVVGCCAFEIGDHDDIHKLPCLWKRLNSHVSKNRSASGKKLHVNDSKKVYSPAAGLKELERSILSLLAAQSEVPADFTDLLRRTAGHVVEELNQYTWYAAAESEQFPLEQSAISIRLFANSFRKQIERAKLNCVHLSARVVLERQLNRQIAATNNKATVLFCTAAIHLDHLLQTYGHQPMTIFCDRQGGREHYGSLLRLMFDEWQLEVRAERDGFSEYLLHRSGNVVRILFCEKAEGLCMPVALASMLSKYLREGFMRRFNAFWSQHSPGVTPTAGYYNDGTRFLRDIENKRRQMGIGDEMLVRCR